MNTSFTNTRANLGLADAPPSALDEQLRGARISKDNTPKDQMGSILKEEPSTQAAETPAVKVAGSVGRYSNVEYWQQKSETFKQQVCALHPTSSPACQTLRAAQQRGPEHGAADSKGAHARVTQPNNLGVNPAARRLLLLCSSLQLSAHFWAEALHG